MYRIKLFSKEDKKESSKSALSLGLGGGALIGGGDFIGKRLGKKINNSFVKDVMETKCSKKDHDIALNRVRSKDIGVSRGISKNYDEVGWNAIDAKDLHKKFKPEDVGRFSGKKAVIEIGRDGEQTLMTTFHELGHAEHMAGRGSKWGRIAHKKVYRHSSKHRNGLGAISGIATAAGTDDDIKGTAISAGIGALGGITGASPEILMEHSANKEGYRLLKEGIGTKNNDLLGHFKKGYSKQLKGRMAQRYLPAAGIGAGSALLLKGIKRYNKKKKNED